MEGEDYNLKHFPSDNSKLAEMEFYLLDDLDCDITVFHPYRTLLALCGKDSSLLVEDDAEAGELGKPHHDGPKYWGTGVGKLELEEGAVQMAWLVRVPHSIDALVSTTSWRSGSSSMILIDPTYACCIRLTS